MQKFILIIMMRFVAFGMEDLHSFDIRKLVTDSVITPFLRLIIKNEHSKAEDVDIEPSNVAPPICGGGGRLWKKSAKGHNCFLLDEKWLNSTKRGGGALGAFTFYRSPTTHHITHYNTVFSPFGSERSPALLPILLPLSYTCLAWNIPIATRHLH